jgi:hypothetical protein
MVAGGDPHPELPQPPEMVTDETQNLQVSTNTDPAAIDFQSGSVYILLNIES